MAAPPAERKELSVMAYDMINGFTYVGIGQFSTNIIENYTQFQTPDDILQGNNPLYKYVSRLQDGNYSRGPKFISSNGIIAHEQFTEEAFRKTITEIFSTDKQYVELLGDLFPGEFMVEGNNIVSAKK